MRAAVLGSPVAHSLSPALHRAAYEALDLRDWSYCARECPAAALPELLAEARADARFGGFSLTMPLKVVALPLVDELEPLAERVGALNTVVPRGGALAGFNTDVPGMVAALQEAGVADARDPVVLGGGGSAQAAIAALAVLGASRATVALRDPAKAEPLRAVAAAAGVELVVTSWDVLALYRGAPPDLVVSTVPAGAADPLAAQLVERGWPGPAALFDIVYAPWPTRLAQVADAAGVRVLGGVDLLVHQAVGQVELMTGRQVPVGVLRAAGEAVLRERTAR